MKLSDVYDYYSREDVQQALFELGKNREVVGVFKNGSYSQRPNTLVYLEDISAMVKTGIIEFHSSIERWSNPMALKSDNYQKLRTGWDIILDIDCEVFEHGRIAAVVLSDALKKHGIKTFYVKFTGGSGFHMGIPWESIPKDLNYKPTVNMFPALARTVAGYLKEFAKEDMEKSLLRKYHVEDLAKQVNKPLGQILAGSGIEPYKIVNIDPVLISPRHLFRMPYSIHRNTGLVSLPINPNDLENFKKERADVDFVKIREKFLVQGEEEEASLLITEAFDWGAKKERAETKRYARTDITKAVPLDMAPPCIHNILRGLSDGKKRSLFILINYLHSLKWSWADIEHTLLEWNQKNSPPLRDSYVRGQIRWSKSKSPKPPPSCATEGWYMSFGVCTPDSVCGGERKTIKNPVNYPFRKMRVAKEAKKRSKTK